MRLPGPEYFPEPPPSARESRDALTIARWRVVALVVGVLWVGAIAAGFGYNLLLAAKLFG
jgi:hypothetical protein